MGAQTQDWWRFAAARTAVLASIAPDGLPRLVPVCHVCLDGEIYFAVDDAKPKTTRRLARLADLRRDPRVSLLASHYAEDWNALWWVRVTGIARVLAESEPVDAALAGGALDALAGKYPPYRAARPPGPVVAVHPDRVLGWAARP